MAQQKKKKKSKSGWIKCARCNGDLIHPNHAAKLWVNGAPCQTCQWCAACRFNQTSANMQNMRRFYMKKATYEHCVGCTGAPIQCVSCTKV